MNKKYETEPSTQTEKYSEKRTLFGKNGRTATTENMSEVLLSDTLKIQTSSGDTSGRIVSLITNNKSTCRNEDASEKIYKSPTIGKNNNDGDYEYECYDKNYITHNSRHNNNISIDSKNTIHNEYYDDEEEVYSNIPVLDLASCTKNVYDEKKNNVSYENRFNASVNIKYNNESDIYTKHTDLKNKRCSNHFNLDLCKNIKEKELSINMFKYIFSDLPDEKCLSNNNIKTFFVDVEFEKGKESGKPTVIISYGSKSTRIVSSEIFKNKIEHKNDIICTIIKFIIFNCEEQLPIIYVNNDTILTRSKFIFEPKSSSNVCSFKKCKNQPILYMHDANKLYCILHSKYRINSNNIKECALYYPYIIFNDMYTSKINYEGLTFFNVKILRLPDVFKYRFGEDLNMFDLE